MIKTNALSAVAQALFIPLAVRAKETQSKDPLFTDKMAVDILAQCDTDHLIMDGGEMSAHGIVLCSPSAQGILLSKDNRPCSGY